MTDILTSIQKLNEDNDTNHKFAIFGDEPTNEAEYNERVKYISGADDNGSSVYSDIPAYTWNEVNTKLQALKNEYDADEYKRKRAAEYKSLAEQLDMQYWDGVNGTTTWADHINAIKTKYPKPE